MAQVIVRQTLCCGSEPDEIWHVITDTERLNRASGMSSLVVTPVDAGAARFLVRTKLGGFEVTFEERPFEWKEPERFQVLRKMRTGPLIELAFDCRIEPAERGCVVTVELRLTPRRGLLTPFVRHDAGKSVARMLKEIARADASIQGEGQRRGGAARRPSRSSNPEAIERAKSALAKQVDADLAARLADHVLHASDAELTRIRPYELALAVDRERREVLAGCLHAVAAGLLDLSWDLICPSCRTASSQHASLAEIGDQGHCQLCDLSFGVELDRSVEATFTPNEAVRRVDVGPYCIGGPARTPHVVAQAILAPSATRELEVPSSEGRYRLFVRGGATAQVEVRAGASMRAEASAGDSIEPARIEVAPGGVVALANRDSIERHAKLEHTEWSNLAATAHEVSSLGAFRRLFSHEILRPGLALRVARVGLFFSDLTGSTALYTRAGDAVAFRLVQDHFNVLGHALEQRGGTIVKTIGDAVMAAFVDELDGLEAALDVLEAFAEFRAHRDDCGGVDVKLGFFAGPSYVVNANGALDYFGQTVNVAARLQGKARSQELVIDAGLAERAAQTGGLDRCEIVERFDAELKGIDVPLACVRLRLQATPPARLGRSTGDDVEASAERATAEACG